MRGALIGLLLAATMATPVAAQAQEARTAKQQRAIAHYQRLEQRNQQRYGNAEQRAQVAQAQPQQRAQRQAQRAERQQARAQGQAQVRNPERQQQRIERQAQRVERQGQRAQRQQRIDRTPSTTGWTGPRNDPRLRDDQQRYDRQARENALRYGTQQQRREYRQEDRRQDRRVDRRDNRRDWSNNWNRGWRNDNRYNWQRYRQVNRNIYRPGRYYAPYRNHSYSRFSIGLTLGSAFFADRYWINDPYQYRLPPAYAGTRWVRYYDDVLLIDVYTGEVVDVIHDFFW